MGKQPSLATTKKTQKQAALTGGIFLHFILDSSFWVKENVSVRNMYSLLLVQALKN